MSNINLPSPGTLVALHTGEVVEVIHCFDKWGWKVLLWSARYEAGHIVALSDYDKLTVIPQLP